MFQKLKEMIYDFILSFVDEEYIKEKFLIHSYITNDITVVPDGSNTVIIDHVCESRVVVRGFNVLSVSENRDKNYSTILLDQGYGLFRIDRWDMVIFRPFKYKFNSEYEYITENGDIYQISNKNRIELPPRYSGLDFLSTDITIDLTQWEINMEQMINDEADIMLNH